ncbi:APC family permease [Pseudonocardia spinosispora]|uniref:APC family permease n=1 Tax=Pseudonocardia spinosispora TaxID=103441 RepID=UPI0005654D7A|nr:amino acid permease [Pseudonocardia spinosispora]
MGQVLRRTISVPQGVALYIGAVVGAGVLLLPGLGASQAGPASLVSWAFDCLLGIPLALTFAALAARSPDAGGVLSYATQAFGPAAGTIAGWFYFFAAATAQTLVALTGAYYIAPYLGLGRPGVFALAAAILVVATGANVRGLRVSGRLQLVFSGLVAVLLLVTIAVSVPRMSAVHWTPFAPHGFGAIGHVGVTIFFAFFGWEAISHLSEEFRDPARAVPLSTALSVGLITLLYGGIALVTVGTGTYGDGEVNRTSIARLLSSALGGSAGVAAALIALLIALGTANAFVAATSRLGYALGRDGVFPESMSRLDDNQVPRTAVLAVGGWAVACLAVSFVAGWDAETLLVVPDSLVIIVYLVATAAAVKLLRGRRRRLAALATLMCCALVPFAGVVLVIPALLAVLALLYRRFAGRPVS